MNDKLRLYAIIGVYSTLMAASMLTLNIYLLFLSIVIFPVIIFVERMWYLIESVIIRRTRIVQLFADYELSGDRSVAVRNVGERYIATAIARMEGEPRKEILRDELEGIITHTPYQFRFTMQMEDFDVEKAVERLKTRRGMLDIALLHSANSPKRNQIRRELGEITHEIEEIGTGGRPIRIGRYLMSSASSHSKVIAEENAKTQIKALAGEFGALLNSDPRILTGNELVEALRIDSCIV